MLFRPIGSGPGPDERMSGFSVRNNNGAADSQRAAAVQETGAHVTVLHQLNDSSAADLCSLNLALPQISA